MIYYILRKDILGKKGLVPGSIKNLKSETRITRIECHLKNHLEILLEHLVQIIDLPTFLFRPALLHQRLQLYNQMIIVVWGEYKDILLL